MHRAERFLLVICAAALSVLLVLDGAAGFWARLAAPLGSVVVGSAFGVADHHLATYRGRRPEDTRWIWTFGAVPLSLLGALLIRDSGEPAYLPLSFIALPVGLVFGSIWLDERR
jgi:hypothetical protein